YVIPITLTVLIGLFLVQSRGSERIGMYFGPIMALWFAVLAVAGLVQVVRDPAVLGALDPRYGSSFLAGHGWIGFLVLGSVFLALTGAEALYADMGHFGRGPIRLDWFALVLPALVLNYFGQGALVLAHLEALDSPFFKLFPDWALWPVVLLATASTVIASQAVISGAFSLSQQAMQLGLLPRLDVLQTSKEAIGQVYVPQINWLLMVCVLGLVLSFGSSDNLAAAYGIAVAGTMVITTSLLAVVARNLWRWSLPVTVAVVGFFLVVDVAFFAANAVKVPQGGWFPLLVGAVMFMLMSTWRRGRQIILERTKADNPPLRQFIAQLDPSQLPRVKGTAVYLAKRQATAPYSLLDNLRHNKVLHERIVLLTVITERIPFVPEAKRMELEPLSKGFTEMSLHFGFAEPPDVPLALAAHRAEFQIDIAETSFFLGRETPVPTVRPELSVWREKLYAFMGRNAVSASDYFRIPPKRVVELGTQVEL
ncbi:MAG: KUP/HAK/KT family potassium transporter, partial [Acidobacteriaceae bacterium]|nr:KUP/HAK/KT family potassium transporter [Acidobacteriaceae bacterium]